MWLQGRSPRARRALLERVEDDNWFFDTELLYQAERSRLAIHEVPVRWVDDPDSRVQIVATAREDLRGIRRLRRAAKDARRPAGRERTDGKTPHAATADARFDLASHGV